MNDKIKIGIVGYGNLGKGVELALSKNKDMELVAIFTRRDPSSFENKLMINYGDIEAYKDKIDVMILCGGSANDLDLQTPEIAKLFNTVDSFDNHNRIPEYFDKINEVAKKSNTLSLISVGWDPGLFSLNRLLFNSVLSQGKDFTFWGHGVSQGHSDAIRKVDGVKLGIQYTAPIEACIEMVRNFQEMDLPSYKTHRRICYIVAEEGSNLSLIENTIKTMPDYFHKYETVVNFISEEEFIKNHNKMSHGGIVLRTGSTSEGNNHKMEFSLNLDSNPEFTSSVLVAYARAVYRMKKKNNSGAISIFDIPIKYLSTMSDYEMRKNLL